jgi:dTDP-4-amino-4,6-dideoxygalactose transaminase
MAEENRIRLADLSRQHVPIMAEMEAAIKRVVERGDFILGADVAGFEREFAAYLGVARVVGVDNGTSALELILRALKVGPGDEVIVPAMTFVATASSVLMTGARPVFVDVDPVTGAICVDKVIEKIGVKKKYVIPVHLYGYPAPIAPLIKAGEYLTVIEDCCQAHGARLGNNRVGSLGTASAFSFYPAKNLGCLGDGGAVATNDSALAEKICKLRNYGQARKYEHVELAYNRRLDTIQAAVLRIKLKRLDEWNAERRKAAGLYHRALAKTRLVLPPEPQGGQHVYYMYVVRSQKRDALVARLDSRGIETGIHYPHPLHLQPVFADLGYKEGDFPGAEMLAREALSLPMYPGITEGEIGRVAEAVADFERKG